MNNNDIIDCNEDCDDFDPDGDGTSNCNDDCPDDGGKTAPGICGCGISDADDDGDGTPVQRRLSK